MIEVSKSSRIASHRCIVVVGVADYPAPFRDSYIMPGTGMSDESEGHRKLEGFHVECAPFCALGVSVIHSLFRVLVDFHQKLKSKRHPDLPIKIFS